MIPRKLITFDWAMKRLLRSKANFGILEGFLSELLHDDIRIQEILESESNKDSPLDKYNRVDMKVRNQAGELLIIEVQYERQYDYLQRMLYGTSRAITEHQQEGEDYGKIVKVISVNILFFDLGVGKDYIYHGTTNFIGIHEKDQLCLSEKQQALYAKDAVYQIYPEYYLLRVNNFDDNARSSLDEWMYFFKNQSIKKDFTAKGLKEADQVLQILNLSDEERLAYNRYQDDLRHQASVTKSNYDSGKLAGEKIGMEKGLEQGEKVGIEKGRKEGLKQGLEKGRAEGETAALVKTLRRQLVRRFGDTALTLAQETQINAASAVQLEHWLDSILEANSLDELLRKLPQAPASRT